MADVAIASALAPSVAAPCAPSVASNLTSARVQLPIVAPATLLGSALKADWDSRAGAMNGVSWTDQQAMIALAAGGGMPAYGSDGSFFNGLSVWKPTASQWLSNALVSLLVSGNVSFHISTVFRLPDGSASTKLILLARNSSAQISFRVLAATGGTGKLSVDWGTNNMSSANDSFALTDTSVHRVEIGTWDGQHQIWCDGTQLATTSTTLFQLNRNVEQIGIPVVSGASNAINTASLRITTPAPSAAQRAQLRAYDASVWGSR